MLTSLGVVVAGALVLAGATTPAQADHLGKKVVTNFSFQSSNWATRVIANDVELRSARTAYAYIACTRVANRHTKTIGQTVKVNANDMIQVSALESQVRTYFKRKKGETGVRGTNVIGRVQLGSDDGPKLTIEGLRTVARAYHVRGKGFRTAKRINWASIGLTTGNEEFDGAAGQLLEAINTQVVGEVFNVLSTANDGKGVAIPGLGTVSLGRSFERRKRGSIERSQYALVVKLENGSKIQIGRAWAKISTEVPTGVFHGAGFGTNIKAIEQDGTEPVVRIGRTAAKPLPCNGTDGKIQSRSLAGLNLGGSNMLEADAIKSSVYGVFGKGKRARGWTQNEIAKVKVGDAEQSLVISAIKGRANVRRGAKGKVFANSKGTNPAISIKAGGTDYTPAELVDALNSNELVIPNLVAIRFNVRKKLKRGIKVVAVRITLGESADSALATIDLGNAIARIRSN